MNMSRRWLIGAVVAGIAGSLGSLSSGFGEDPFAQQGAQQAQVQSDEQQSPVPAAKKKSQSTADYTQLIRQALHGTAEESARAVQELRNSGPTAVQALLARPEYRPAARWVSVVDAVAQQRDAQFSGLYWYTDLNQALEVAQREHKPVLSLRLLGKLTDELSCANSRFFRTALYPNPNVRALLADKYVLHWQTVRSVPIITIDFGDGRKLERTITGNSLHMILDEQGRTVDVLPGLYGPGVFAQQLAKTGEAAASYGKMNEAQFQHFRTEFHKKQMEEMHVTWQADWVKAGVSPAPALASELDDATWSQIAMLYTMASTPRGDAAQAVASKGPDAERAGRLALTKSVAETPMMRMVRNVTKSISEDTVRNEYHLHARIHMWFMSQSDFLANRDQLVNRVYSDLFLSPVDDPWYGLSKPDVYSAIPKDGRIGTVAASTGR